MGLANAITDFRRVTYNLEVAQFLLERPRPARPLIAKVVTLLGAVHAVAIFEDKLFFLGVPV